MFVLIKDNISLGHVFIFIISSSSVGQKHEL